MVHRSSQKANLGSDQDLEKIFTINKVDGYPDSYTNVKIFRGSFDRCSQNPAILVYAYSKLYKDESGNPLPEYTPAYIFLIRKDGEDILFNHYYSGSGGHWNGYISGGPQKIRDNLYIFVVNGGGYGSAAAWGSTNILLLENLKFVSVATFTSYSEQKDSGVIYDAKYEIKDVDGDGEQEFVIKATAEEMAYGGYDGAIPEDILLQQKEKSQY